MPTDSPKDLSKAISSEEQAWDAFWRLYVTEAQRYDNALLERWRDDMEAILFFV